MTLAGDGAGTLAALLATGSLLEPQPRVVLRGEAANGYVRLLRALLDRSRLNTSFPDRRRVGNLLAVLAPEGNHLNYNELEIGGRTGLPTERMITRVQADLAVAQKVCRDEEKRCPELRSQPVKPSSPEDDRHLRRYRYHRRLLDQPPQPSFAQRFQLRRVDKDRGSVQLTAILDRFDLSEELFARYTVHLAHTAEGWARSQVRVDGDRLEVSDNFANLLARTTAHDSEIAFILLSEIPSLKVESVSRCRIGPLYGAGMSPPKGVAELLEEQPGELVLCFPAERTAVDINQDSSDDPFEIGFRDFIGEQARHLVEARRSALGYHVRRQRKMVSTAGVAPSLRELLRQRRSSCVLYTLR